jgi:hypothetical protein
VGTLPRCKLHVAGLSRPSVQQNIVIHAGGRKRMRTQFTVHSGHRGCSIANEPRTTQSTVLYNITKNDELQVRHHRASISAGREHHFEWGVGFGGGGGEGGLSEPAAP